MFRMYGRIVQVLRYRCTAEENADPTGKSTEKSDVCYAHTLEEADTIGTDVQLLPPEDDDWMDGLEVADVPDTYGEAVKIRDMGQAAYEQARALERSPEQLRADVDYIAAMTGVSL